MPGLLRLKRGGRKHRAKQVNDAPNAGAAAPAEFQVDRCEYVSVDARSTLLRLEGRPGERLEVGGLSVVTHTAPGQETHSLLLPPTSVESGRWLIAFGVPTAAVEDPDARFELSDGNCTVAVLPSPAELAEPTEEAAPSAEEVRDLRVRLDRERNGRIRVEEQLGDNAQDLTDARAVLEQLEKRCAISERNLAELRQKLLFAWTESGELRELLAACERSHEKGKNEVRRRRVAERELRALLGRQERDLTAARENVQ